MVSLNTKAVTLADLGSFTAIRGALELLQGWAKSTREPVFPDRLSILLPALSSKAGDRLTGLNSNASVNVKLNANKFKTHSKGIKQ